MLLFFSLLVFLRSLRISMIINQTEAEDLLPEGKLFSVLEPFKIRSMGIWRIGGDFNCLFRQSDQIFLYLARIHQFYAKRQILGDLKWHLLIQNCVGIKKTGQHFGHHCIVGCRVHTYNSWLVMCLFGWLPIQKCIGGYTVCNAHQDSSHFVSGVVNAIELVMCLFGSLDCRRWLWQAGQWACY